MSKESVSNYNSLSRDTKFLSLSFSREYKLSKIIPCTSGQEIHGQPATVCGINIRVKRSCCVKANERICAGQCDVSCGILESDRFHRARVNASQRWPPEKPCRCFRSPLVGKREKGRKVMFRFLRKRTRHGNDERKFCPSLYRPTTW